MVTYLYILHCMDFSVNSQWWGEGEMMRPSVQGVDPPVCCTPGCYCYICKRQLCGFPQCAASWMTYARDSFVDSQGGLLSSRGGDVDTLAQTHWHQSYRNVSLYGTLLFLACFKMHGCFLWATFWFSKIIKCHFLSSSLHFPRQFFRRTKRSFL